ncbi:MAG TPA: hypothetical protein VHO50_00740 [Bacteroidales bacterium]|nr:hypothetical protein [Bacteroidales bacterium]
MNSERIYGLDLLRGITLILGLIICNLQLLLPEKDLSELYNWIFRSFVFIAGMSIPLSITKRIKAGEDNYSISKHLGIRSLGLIITGVLILNIYRIDSVLAGMRTEVWALLLYTGIFLTWKTYSDNDKNYFTNITLRLLGMALLAFLVFKFKSADGANDGSIIAGSWGVLGQIGWGYLVSAFFFLLVRDSIMKIAIGFVLFLVLNILTGLDLLTIGQPVHSFIGIITDGYVPMIMVSGMLLCLIIVKYSGILRHTGRPGLIALLGQNALIAYLISGFLYYLVRLAGLYFEQINSGLPILISISVIWCLLVSGITILFVKLGFRMKL